MKGGKILVIDDEPMVREAVGRVLSSEGYAVSFAHDGADAIARVHNDPPDAILLDLMMPGMNGRQFLAALRADLQLDLPVVVMTAVHGLGQRAISLGATDVVEKPFDVDELLNKVALAVFRARQVGASASRAPEPPADVAEPVVVVVDRDVAALGQLDEGLTRAGFVVVAVPSPDDSLPRLVGALDAFAVVVVVDGTADGGEAVVEGVRAVPALAGLPIIAVTRSEHRHAFAAAVDRTAAVTLVRPAADDLIEALRVVERRPRRRRTA
ncbi:MAG: response regulator [Myxococcales bacterium]|nr:response regulator [Myxococcales bacterium]